MNSNPQMSCNNQYEQSYPLYNNPPSTESLPGNNPSSNNANNQFISNAYTMMPSQYPNSTSQSITVNTSSAMPVIKNIGGMSGGSSTADSVGSLNSDYYDGKQNAGTNSSGNSGVMPGISIMDVQSNKKRRKPAPTIATGRRNLKDESVTSEEAERRDKRRERNRKSAQRCRERKIEKKDALQREINSVTRTCQAYIDVADRIISAWKQRILVVNEHLPGHNYESTHINISDFESVIANCKETIHNNTAANKNNNNNSIYSGESSTHDNNSMEPSPAEPSQTTSLHQPINISTQHYTPHSMPPTNNQYHPSYTPQHHTYLQGNTNNLYHQHHLSQNNNYHHIHQQQPPPQHHHLSHPQINQPYLTTEGSMGYL